MKNSIAIFLFFLTLIATAGTVLLNVEVWNNPNILSRYDLADAKKQTWSPPEPDNKNTQQLKQTKTQFNHLLNRPLFSPTRRLTAKAKPTKRKKIAKRVRKTTSKALFNPKKFRVKGILILGTQNKVLLTWPDFTEGKWLSVGDVIKSWKVSKIENSTIQMVFGRQRVSLPLYVEKSQ